MRRRTGGEEGREGPYSARLGSTSPPLDFFSPPLLSLSLSLSLSRPLLFPSLRSSVLLPAAPLPACSPPTLFVFLQQRASSREAPSFDSRPFFLLLLLLLSPSSLFPRSLLPFFPLGFSSPSRSCNRGAERRERRRRRRRRTTSTTKTTTRTSTSTTTTTTTTRTTRWCSRGTFRSFVRFSILHRQKQRYSSPPPPLASLRLGSASLSEFSLLRYERTLPPSRSSLSLSTSFPPLLSS